MKMELKNMHRIKSYSQKKIRCEILAISFVFWPILRPKMALPEAALPMGSHSLSLYFWNQWSQENGISFSADSKFDFCFFLPPPSVEGGEVGNFCFVLSIGGNSGYIVFVSILTVWLCTGGTNLVRTEEELQL